MDTLRWLGSVGFVLVVALVAWCAIKAASDADDRDWIEFLP